MKRRFVHKDGRVVEEVRDKYGNFASDYALARSDAPSLNLVTSQSAMWDDVAERASKGQDPFE